MPEQQTARRLPEWALMYALHNAFRRDLDALAATRASPAAIRARWAIFCDQLQFHHLAEDQVMWPPVRVRLTGDRAGLALLEAMEDEHRQIDPLLAAVDDALTGTSLAQLAGPLSRLRTTLASHLSHEEADVMPRPHTSVSVRDCSPSSITEALGAISAAPVSRG
jgi:iron-sulfur cluster repair protein YtfE (RIC family)